MQNSILQWLAGKFLDRSLSPRELLTARKVVYAALILVLFTGSFFWRTYAVAQQADALAIREEKRGDLELSGSVLRLSLSGLRGVATCFLWINAIETQKKNQWSELEFQTRWLARLQPHFIKPWLFQSWNLSYNVSVESDRISDKYYFITRGILLLGEGERMNHDSPDIRWSIGHYLQQKICNSDETNVHRSLFQLSFMPPGERNPARFWHPPDTPGGARTLNWEEFEKFCWEHPRLVRRLHDGLRREMVVEDRLFKCQSPENVIQFLTENWRVPSLYQEFPNEAGVYLKKPLEERFPPLPPPRDPQPPQRLFQPTETWKDLTHDSKLGEDVDGYCAARAWMGYAQEPLPDPDWLPGMSRPIEDRARQRRAKDITTLLFRDTPILAQTHRSEGLQAEGWFNETSWEVRWLDGQSIKVERIPEGMSSLESWKDTYEMWRKFGERNHLYLVGVEMENKRTLAERYWTWEDLPNQDKGKPFGSLPYAPTNVDPRYPPRERERQTREQLEAYIEDLPKQVQPEYKAARFLYDYEFYRRLANFPHQLTRSQVEAEPETVAARQTLFQAESYRLQAALDRAVLTYYNPDKPEESGIGRWRDQVLSVKDLDRHREYRQDRFIQESTYEIQLRYLDVFRAKHGKKLKEEVTILLGLMHHAGELNRVAGGGCLIPDCLALARANLETPAGTLLSWFNGPFDIQIMDPRPEQAAGAVGLLISSRWLPSTGGPLLATPVLLLGRSRPLLDPGNVQTVRMRKGLMSPPRKEKDEKDKGKGKARSKG